MSRINQVKERGQRARKARRAFSLIELLVVIAILALIVAIGVAQASRFVRRSKVDSTSDTIRNFIQEAGAQVQKQNLPVFVELSWIPPTPSTPGFYRLRAIADSGSTGGTLEAPYNTYSVGDARNDATKDTIVATYDVPSDIALSSVNASTIESTLWSGNGADTTTRALECDFQHRTIDPTLQRQIAGIATLSVTHRDMLLSTRPLKPLVNDQIRINPIWNARIARSVS